MGFLWFILGGAVGAVGSYFVDRASRPRCPSSFRRVAGNKPASGILEASIVAPYSALVDAFGEPEAGDGRQTFNVWVFEGPGGAYSIQDHRTDGSKKSSYTWDISGDDVFGMDLLVTWLTKRLKK